MRKLKPSVKEFLKKLNKETVELVTAGFKPNAINARESIKNLTEQYNTEKSDVAKIVDDIIPKKNGFCVPIRIFHPNPKKELPVMIFFHGGGFIAGSVTVYDTIYRNLAAKTNHIIIAPEYRLAPENPYPAGEIDSRSVYYGILPLLKRIKMPHKKELVVAGDSGGGTLAAALVRDVQHDKTMPLKAMVLIYPGLDFTMSYPSYKKTINGKGYLLEKEKSKWYFDNYFQQGENRRLLSPLFGEFSEDMPPTLLFSAEFCPLRDENIAYVEKCKEAGVQVEHHHLENMIHTFLNIEDLCKEETEFVYKTINDFLHQ